MQSKNATFHGEEQIAGHDWQLALASSKRWFIAFGMATGIGESISHKVFAAEPPKSAFCSSLSSCAMVSIILYISLYALYIFIKDIIFIRNCSKPQISSESGPPQRPELCKVLVEMSPSIRTGLNSFWSTGRSWRTDFSCGWRCHVILVKWLGSNISFVF